MAQASIKLVIFYFGKHEMHGGIIVALVFH